MDEPTHPPTKQVLKRRFLLQSLLAFVLLLGISVQLGRLFHLTGGGSLDLGGRGIATLSPSTRAFLQELDQNLSITYFATFQERLPSPLKGLESQVRALLTAFQKEAPERIDWRVIDPELSGVAGIEYAARKGASSFSVRRVLGDEHREQQIWSSLVLETEDGGETLIQGVGKADLPYLEELIVAHLKALEQPPQPVFAVAAPPGFSLLQRLLGESGRVVSLDLDRQPTIPPEVDVLFWIQPAVVTSEHERQLQRFVAAGHSAVLAGSAYRIDYQLGTAPPRYVAHRLSDAWEGLLRPLGLRPLPDLLMDRNVGPLFVESDGGSSAEVEAPFHLRCLPSFYNMKSFSGPALGGLSFAAASALECDPRRVAEAGFQAELVGTTTEDAWVIPLPEEPFTQADLESGLKVPKQNLMVLLKSDDPWKGQILVLASSSLLEDHNLNHPGYGHQVFLRTLVRTFAEPQRLVRGRIERQFPQPLPALGLGSRLSWRFFASLLTPLLFLGVGLWRYTGGFRKAAIGRGGRLALGTMAGTVAVLLIGQLGRLGKQLNLDLTEDRLNTLAPLTRRLLTQRGQGLEAELFITPPSAMPPSLKQLEDRLRTLLAQGHIPLRAIQPNRLSPQERETLRGQGIGPFPVQRVLRDTLITQPVWSGLRLRQDDRMAVIPRLDPRAVEHLEFLLAAALIRLQQGRAPLLAVISDLPRLSPAEAMEDYQRKGLIPPSGVDVYSQVKSLLTDYGYQVFYVNPREPVLPDSAEVFLWLQPRRDSSRIIQLLSQHLARGGKGIVALQHFNIQQRQYRGSGFQTVYWPQPQFQDLDPYLQLFGVEQIREVLMDRTQSHLELETQVNRAAVREYDPQEVALPFLIRAVAAHYAPDSPLTRHLGDLLFIWGNRFALDPSRLAAAGLESQVLIATSDQAWSYAWQGGWLPSQAFAPSGYLSGPQPLAVLLQGRFPAVEVRIGEEGRPLLVPQPPSLTSREGTLLLIGCSEMFKNDYLHLPGFAHDQFLLNAVAYLAYGPELAELQARHRDLRGFPFQPLAVKIFWRLAAVWTGPLILSLFGLVRYARRRRPLRLP